MYGRIYKIPMVAVAISAAQDLWTLKSATNFVLAIHEIRLSQKNEDGDANEDEWELIFQHLASGYTAGSGGTAPTPVARGADSAAQFTARMNDTTQATGTVTAEEGDGWNIRVPYRQVWTPETRPIVQAAGVGWRINMASTPKAATTVTGVIIAEEIG